MNDNNEKIYRIELTNEEYEFLDKPDFKSIYPFIKELLTNKDHICFGFDVSNDLRFLNGEYKRYKYSKI